MIPGGLCFLFVLTAVVAATLVVVVGMWCSSLLCTDRRTMLGHMRFSLSGFELKWSGSHRSFYCCFCVRPSCSLLVSGIV